MTMKQTPKSPLNFLDEYEDESAKLYNSDGSPMDEEKREEAARTLMRMDLEEIISLQSGAGVRFFREMFGFSGGIFSEDMGRNPETDARRGMRIMALRYFNMLSEGTRRDEIIARVGPPYSVHPYFVPEQGDKAQEYLERIGRVRNLGATPQKDTKRKA